MDMTKIKTTYIAIIALFSIIAFSNQALASECDLTATGFGNSAYNGTYTDLNDPYNGEPQFFNGTVYLTVNGSGYDPDKIRWLLDTVQHPTNSIPYYRTYSGSGTYVGAYTGGAESGSIVESCPVVGGGGGTSLSDTISNSNSVFQSSFTVPLSSPVDFMSTWLKYVLGSGLAILQYLLPYIIGLVVISTIISFTYTAFKYLRN